MSLSDAAALVARAPVAGVELTEWSRPIISPSPGVTEWSSEDAELSRTVIFTLGSGSKKAGPSFSRWLRIALLIGGLWHEATESGGSIGGMQLHFEHCVVDYETVPSPKTLHLISTLNAQRCIIIDFGGRGRTREEVPQRLRGHLPDTSIQIIAVGSAPKVYTSQELQALVGQRAWQHAIQLNTSPMIEALMTSIGEHQAQEQLISEFWRVTERETARTAGTERADEVLGLRLDVREGICGQGGLEVAWNQLCEGKTKPNTACVIVL